MTDVRHDILKGLAWNPAAPNGVLLRLLSPEASSAWFWLCLRPDPPAEVVDAMINHPDFRVRGSIAESWNADPADRARLVDDPEPKVRMALASGPEPFRMEVAPLPDAAYQRLLSDPDKEVRYWAVRSRSIPARILAGYADHADPAVRVAVCRVWDGLAPATREALLADPDTEVRRAAALRACVDDGALTDELLDTLDKWPRADVLMKGRLTRATAERLVASEDSGERYAVASNPSLPPDLVTGLASDPEHHVRLAISLRPGLTEDKRAAVDYRVDPKDRSGPVRWVWNLGAHDIDVLRRCATSGHVLLRRSAAANRHLPVDLVGPLAHDEDFAVRLLTCEYQPSAPADALLRMVLEWSGYTRADMLARPQFPRQGLAGYADDEDPAVRMLAVYDPGASPELIERLSRDESTGVRYTAAGDPRLTLARIEELLTESDTAQAAAGNPALPVAVMHRLLDETVPRPQ
ncbi:hypothetical protein [Streptomyces sp. NBC_00038]|uniref:hypothetical protein n=1 Tax=Streptomyces sp. NBC_00038 TaxID=2903615 RepID=UPI0022506E17|nr:hypothetical protein [Streptomyces sp. NBC_00038]MCX5563272.1 hypothetical protein [Streptomyces sp. NBC_00038]